MTRTWPCVMVLASCATSAAGPRYDVEAGLAADHLSGGQCDSGNGFVSACDGRTALAVRLEAAQVLQPDRIWSLVARELIGGGRVVGTGAGTLFRSGLGLGGRLQFLPHGYVELTAGVDLQVGDTGTGEGGVASGINLALAPRIGTQWGRWALAVETNLVPGASGEVGMADYGVGVLASRALP